jgi:hypothetical protein
VVQVYYEVVGVVQVYWGAVLQWYTGAGEYRCTGVYVLSMYACVQE